MKKLEIFSKLLMQKMLMKRGKFYQLRVHLKRQLIYSSRFMKEDKWIQDIIKIPMRNKISTINNLLQILTFNNNLANFNKISLFWLNLQKKKNNTKRHSVKKIRGKKNIKNQNKVYWEH